MPQQLPKNAADWVEKVNPRAVLAIALKAEQGGSDFQGGRCPGHPPPNICLISRPDLRAFVGPG